MMVAGSMRALLVVVLRGVFFFPGGVSTPQFFFRAGEDVTRGGRRLWLIRRGIMIHNQIFFVFTKRERIVLVFLSLLSIQYRRWFLGSRKIWLSVLDRRADFLVAGGWGLRKLMNLPATPEDVALGVSLRDELGIAVARKFLEGRLHGTFPVLVGFGRQMGDPDGPVITEGEQIGENAARFPAQTAITQRGFGDHHIGVVFAFGATDDAHAAPPSSSPGTSGNTSWCLA